MKTASQEPQATVEARAGGTPNGAAAAAFLAAGIGSLAVGLFVLLSESDLFVAPALYAPSGGVSGRTAFAALTWLISWGVLHRRWRDRDVDARLTFLLALGIVALGLVATFPPLWGIF
jgi:hypothetical protein